MVISEFVRGSPLQNFPNNYERPDEIITPGKNIKKGRTIFLGEKNVNLQVSCFIK